MDTPDPLNDASSLPHEPDITPNSADFASPVPVPSRKSTTPVRRKAARRKAKPSFLELDNENDDDQERGYDGKPSNKPRTFEAFESASSNFQCSPTAFKPDTKSHGKYLSGCANQTSDVSTPAPINRFLYDCDDEPEKIPQNKYLSGCANYTSEVSTPASVHGFVYDWDDDDPQTSHSPHHAPVPQQSAEVEQRNIPEHEGLFKGLLRSGLVETASTAASPEPWQQKEKLWSGMRGESAIDTDETNNKIDESADDQVVKKFSLSALPPSRGNSPATIKTKPKTATKKRSTKEPAKESKKKAARQAATHQRKPMTDQPMTDQPKPRKANRVPSLELFSSGEDNKIAVTIGPDLQEKEEKIARDRSRQAEFKPLKSPINSHLAATQDIISISSGLSDSFEEEDDKGDDDFVPTSSHQIDSTQPKTRAETRYRVAKPVSRSLNGSRAAHENLATDNSAAGVKPKTPPKQKIKASPVLKKSLNATGVQIRPQVKNEKGLATSAPSQVKQSNAAHQSAIINVSENNTQLEKYAGVTIPASSKFKQTKSRLVNKLGHTHEADSAAVNGSRNHGVDSFSRDGPKSNFKLQRTAKASMSQPNERHCLPGTEDVASETVKAESTTVSREVRKQRPTKTVRSHPDRHQAGWNAQIFAPVVEADEENQCTEPVYDYQAHVEGTLLDSAPSDRVPDNHYAAVSDDGLIDYADGETATGVEAFSTENVNSIVLPENNNNLPTKQVKVHVGLQKDSPDENNPARFVTRDEFATGPNPLKRRLPEERSVTQTANQINRGSWFRDCLKPMSSSSSVQRSIDSIVPPLNKRNVAKKSRLEALRTSVRSPNEQLANGAAASSTLVCDSGDDVFNSGYQDDTIKRTTAFVRKCTSKPTENQGHARVEAPTSSRNQHDEQGRVRARALHQPDTVMNRVLAEISNPTVHENTTHSSHDESGKISLHDGHHRLCHQPRVSEIDQREQAWKKATEPYGEGIGDIMHRTVNVILRSLKTKEDAINDVIEDYGMEGKHIVSRLSAEHEKERKRLAKQYEQCRLNYIQACLEARHRTESTLNDLMSEDLSQIMTRVGKDPAVGRLKRLQKAIQRPS
ncbi:hypothetical protein VP1G_08163 [Cytospora mali]|uniref:Uncharacterized protein n=1 Tax=Cytospora mali TaxID=578113 RepID=A0A194VAQ1_CYTMA|nr:hypothetical protein VP1G_08163 [Valsa mali var. pyri (nom. inval.)]